MKADLELVKLVLQRNSLDVRQVATILPEINQEVAAQVDESEPPVKKQYAIVISDPRGLLAGKDFTGWVVQLAEEESPATVADKLLVAVSQFNATPKGRRLPLKTMGEAFEHLPARFLKEQNLWARTKEPVSVLPVANKL